MYSNKADYLIILCVLRPFAAKHSIAPARQCRALGISRESKHRSCFTSNGTRKLANWAKLQFQNLDALKTNKFIAWPVQRDVTYTPTFLRKRLNMWKCDLYKGATYKENVVSIRWNQVFVPCWCKFLTFGLNVATCSRVSPLAQKAQQSHHCISYEALSSWLVIVIQSKQSPFQLQSNHDTVHGCTNHYWG